MTSSESQLPRTEAASQAPPATMLGKLLAILGVLVSLLFLANLTFGGFIPLEIPDALPFIGNLDEVFFTSILLASLAKLGIPLLPNLAVRPRRDKGEREA